MIDALTGGRGRPYGNASGRYTAMVAPVWRALSRYSPVNFSMEFRVQLSTPAPSAAKAVRKGGYQDYQFGAGDGATAVKVPGWLPGLLERSLNELLAAQPDLQLQRGKYVFELKPGGCDKGTAVSELMSMPPFAGRKPVFIGDDLTDEHGFKVVNQMGGLSIKVGNGSTCARYRISGVDAVHGWLACMTEGAGRN